MAAQFIDLAREITHSPFPNQLRSVTWPSGSPLVGVGHVPDQIQATGNKQQTRGWNSGAVALPDEIDKRVATQIHSDTRERELSDHSYKSDKILLKLLGYRISNTFHLITVRGQNENPSDIFTFALFDIH
jgi:hypothetical protein